MIRSAMRDQLLQRLWANTTRKAAIGLTLLMGAPVTAQLTVSPQTDLQELARTISGPGVQIANPVIDCHGSGYGEFTYAGQVLGLSSGVLLTSGNIANAVGPNTVENRTFQAQTPGNALLNTVTGRTTYDACRFEFDVIPGGDTLRFNFAFASEEYNEWVGSQYNDVFGFFISGPGIDGDPGIAPHMNIALVPNTEQAVTINNVNNGSNQEYYHDNVGGQHIQYDGITRGLQAVAVVQPCQTYRLQLIVADASDRKFDSGVFVERIQSNSVTMEAFTVSGFPNIIEGCNPGVVRFTRQNVTPDPLVVPFFLGGDAVNGLDYPLIGDPSPQVAKLATIPAGMASVDVAIDAFADGIAEGIENIRVYLGSTTCPGFYLDSLDILVQDSLFGTVNAPLSICPGGSAQLLASGGLTYSWSPATGLNNATIADPIASPASNTSYTVTISAGDCTSALNTSITINNVTLSAVTTRPLCNGQGNGAINLSVSGGTAPYEYAWTGPNGFQANTEDLTNIAAGTYTVTVADATGCVRTQSFNVGAPAALAITLTPSILPFGQNIACHGSSTGSLDLSISGGTAPYSISWTGPNGFSSNTEDLSSLPAGTYSVLVTDMNGCTASGERTLSEPPAMQVSFSGISMVGCHGTSTGSASAGIAGGIPPYSYSWNSSPVQTSATATDLAAGIYTVTVTDGYGCTSTGQLAITEPQAPLQASITDLVNVSHCQGAPSPSGSALALANGGTAPYSYVWNTTPAQQSAQVLFSAGGTYQVVITDDNGCSAQASVNVTATSQAIASISSVSNSSCFGVSDGSLTVEVTGGGAVNSITWNTTPPQIGATATDLSPGNYSATIVHADGCTTLVDGTIGGPAAAMQVSIQDVADVNCFGSATGSASVIATGGTAPYTYAWSTGPAQLDATATGLESGSYTVTVTDAAGCNAAASTTIGGPAQALSVGITGFTNVLCFETAQGTASAQAQGGTAPYTYTWNTTPAQFGPNASELAEGTWVVDVVDANGCTAATSVAIGGPQFGIDAYFEEVTHITCHGANDGSATVSASGGSNSFTITWNTAPPIIGHTATGLSAGMYEVEIVDNNGCDTPKYIHVEILESAEPLTINLAITPATCTAAADGSIDLTISGGTPVHTIVWSDQYGNSTGTEDLSDLDVDTYFLSVTDAYGCRIDTSATIIALDVLGVSANVVQIPCTGLSNGALEAVATDGLAPFQYNWTGPDSYVATGASISDLDEGTYNVTLTDGSGCSVSTSVTLTASNPPTLLLQATTYIGGANTSCAGTDDASVDLTIVGGTAPFTILWTDGLGFTSTDVDISDIGAGAYQVHVTDANGCTASELILLNAPAALGVLGTVSDSNGYAVSCAGGSDGNIELNIFGGTAPYTTSWSNGASTTSNTGLGAGTYSVEITDANGCTATTSFQLEDPAPLEASVEITILPGGAALSCAGGNDGSFSTSIEGGTAPYLIAWNGPGGFSSSADVLTDLVAGTYNLIVTDLNGCSTSTSAVLSEPAPVTIQLNTTTYNGGFHIACNGEASGSISASVAGGTGALTLTWTGPDGFVASGNTISDLVAGTYVVMATDANGCHASNSITLTEAPLLEVDLVVAQYGAFEVSCLGNDGSIMANINGGTPQFEVSWTGPNGAASTDLLFSGLAQGSYHLVITDANGCIFQDDLLLQAPPALTASFTSTAAPCAGGTGDLAVLAQGGNGNFSYSWSGPGGFTSQDQSLNDVQAGNYALLLTDGLGCTATFQTTVGQATALGSGTYVSQYGNYNIACAGDSTGVIELTPQGGNAPYTVNVSGPHGYQLAGTSHNGLHAGSYSVTITDTNGCSMDTTITLTAPEIGVTAVLDISIYPSGTNISCHGASDGWINATVIGGEGPFSFFWRGPDSLEFTTPFIDGLPAGDYAYELVVTDANECSFFTEVTLIEPDEALSANYTTSAFGDHELSCSTSNDGSVAVNVQGGNGATTISWSGPDGFSDSTFDPSGLAPGNYEAVMVDMNGCTTTLSITLQAPEPVQGTLVASSQPSGTSISCQGANDGSINASINGGTGPYTLAWIGPDGFTSDLGMLEALAPGVYCLEATDAFGCSFSDCITITEPQALSASATAVHAECGNANGAVQLVVNGGSAPMTYAWNNGSTAQDLSGLEPGNFEVLISDANGCTAVASALVTGTPAVSAEGITTNNLCFGDATGTIDLELTSGIAPFQVLWNTGATGNSLSGLSAGSYSVVITDANGCTFTASYVVSQKDELHIDLQPYTHTNGYNISMYQGNSGSVQTSVSGGTAPYSYAWSNGANTPDLFNLSAGTYLLEVTDANGCTAQLSITLTEPSDLEMPTGFSPNGDGANDFFFIRGLDAYPANTFVVLNRWGNVVYDRLNYRNDWRGENTQGQDLPNGTYFVILKVDEGSRTLQGYVDLRR